MCLFVPCQAVEVHCRKLALAAHEAAGSFRGRCFCGAVFLVGELVSPQRRARARGVWTGLALEWLLASVLPGMLRKARARSRRVRTRLALVRLLASVCALMLDERRLAPRRERTGRTMERFDTGMDEQMAVE